MHRPTAIAAKAGYLIATIPLWVIAAVVAGCWAAVWFIYRGVRALELLAFYGGDVEAREKAEWH